MRMHRFVTVAVTLLATSVALASPKKAAKAPASKKQAAALLQLDDEPRKIAVAYLEALDGSGNDDARNYLLGEVTFTAEDFTIPNWKIVKRLPAKKESAFLAPAVKAMQDLDKAGASALNKMLDLGGNTEIEEITKEQADKILAPTKKLANALTKDFPLFAYMARVGKDVYFHPKNPWRVLLRSLDQSGKYELEFHRFEVEETTVAGKRVWPLRVLRLKTDAYDSGWKILPASDWDPDF